MITARGNANRGCLSYGLSNERPPHEMWTRVGEATKVEQNGRKKERLTFGVNGLRV